LQSAISTYAFFHEERKMLYAKVEELIDQKYNISGVTSLENLTIAFTEVF